MGVMDDLKETLEYFKEENFSAAMQKQSKESQELMESARILSKLKFTFITLVEEQLASVSAIKLALNPKYKDYLFQLFDDLDIQNAYSIKPVDEDDFMIHVEYATI